MRILKTLAIIFLGLICTNIYAQTKSPEQFFGYELGGRFTLSSNIYRYAEHLAQQQPKKVKIVNYGKTHEMRDLMMVVVGSDENMRNLEQIRIDHLKSIGMVEGTPVSKQHPPFVWLSYNVHGDEATNTEAFSQVLYNLLQANDAVSNKILKNCIVILAPCLNPDGHDRYVNFYNQKLGTSPNPDPIAWEHSQPWPGGRYTHYLFDPNRDWAWQTQEITRLLIAEYHKWMPQIHGDFHEMGPESPYYFAPAAKPYHEDITKWQREGQEIIGSYNKKTFDARNWLYYTRERFDLLYPSYGDTWPTYNGAIGMTFEQGGGGIAGLAYKKSSENDTLTLQERTAHVVAASMSTLEAIADQPTRVADEFVKFFENAKTNPVGEYKSYVIKRKGYEGKVKALCELLDKNQIRYGVTNESKSLQGFSYLNQTDESFSTESGDLIINALQPKSTLLKILFELKPKLEDSLTYDITSWSVPLAYGVNCYGIKEPLQAVTTTLPLSPIAFSEPNPVAYIIEWKSAEDAKFLASMHKNKIAVRVAEKEFNINNKNFDAGTIIITRTGNEHLGAKFDETVQKQAQKFGVNVVTTNTSSPSVGSDFGSDYVFTIKAPKVGVLAGEGTSNFQVGEVWHLFDQDLDYPITLIDPNGRATSGNFLKDLTVLIVPSNFGIIKENMIQPIKDWVRNGGKLILLENAIRQFADKEGFALKSKKDLNKSEGKTTPDSLKLKTYGNRERDAAKDDAPGAIYRISLDNSHPLAFGYSKNYFAIINNVFNYDFMSDGWNVGVIKNEKASHVAGFVGHNVKPKIQNTLIFGVEDMGRGKVVYMANNPLFRGFWYNGKLLFANAVFMVQ